MLETANLKEALVSNPLASNSITVKNLTKLYPVKKRATKDGSSFITANDDISLEVTRGEIFGLLGPNGAGKTTLVNQILGLSKPDAGTINVEGIDVVRQPQLLKAVAAYLPQQTTAAGSIEVWRSLSYTGQLRGQTRHAAEEQAQAIIRELELSEIAHRYTGNLSGGMQRMVSFGMALMGQPKLLVLDEPTNELDPARRRLVWQLIKRVVKERQLTCLLVTHNVLEAETVLDRVAVVANGRVVANGTPGTLKQQFSKAAYLDLSLKSQSNPLDASPIAELLQRWLAEEGIRVQLTTQPHNPLQLRLQVQPVQADQVVAVVIRRLGLEWIDDFKLALPSLEDVYLALVEASGEEVDAEV